MWKKILLIILFIIILLPLFVWLAAPKYANSKLKSLLEKADTASYSYLELDFWNGNLVLHDIYLHDTTGNLSAQPVQLSLDRLAIKGVDLWRAYREKHLVIDSIILGRGFAYVPLTGKDTSAHDNKPLKLPIHQIAVNHLQIDSIGIDLALNNSNLNERFAGVINFKVDSLRIPLNRDAELMYKNTTLRISNIYAQPKKSLAWFTSDSLVYNGLANQLYMHGFKMRQRLDQAHYAKHFGFDKVHIALDVYRLQINGLPKKLGSLQEGVHLPYISVFGMQANLFKDRRLPHPSDEKKFIIEQLSELEIPIRIDTIDIIDGQLQFNENWRDDLVPGRLLLSDIQARMLNLNNTGPTENGNWTTINADITLYQRLKLDVDWRFDLRHNGIPFTLDLGIGRTPFSVLNPFTENTVGLRFKKGNLLGGRLFVEGNKKSGAGTLELYYNDMKVEFLNKEDHHTNIVHWAEGGLANLVVRNNNERGKRERLGIVYAEPLLDRAIFSFAVRMFFSGFKDIALSSNNEAKVAERGMTYLPMPKASKEIKAEEAEKAEKQAEKEARRAARKAKRAAKND